MSFVWETKHLIKLFLLLYEVWVLILVMSNPACFWLMLTIFIVKWKFVGLPWQSCATYKILRVLIILYGWEKRRRQPACHVWPRKCSFRVTCLPNDPSRDHVIMITRSRDPLYAAPESPGVVCRGSQEMHVPNVPNNQLHGPGVIITYLTSTLGSLRRPSRVNLPRYRILSTCSSTRTEGIVFSSYLTWGGACEESFEPSLRRTWMCANQETSLHYGSLEKKLTETLSWEVAVSHTGDYGATVWSSDLFVPKSFEMGDRASDVKKINVLGMAEAGASCTST